MKKKLEDIIWQAVFHKPKPNLPFKIEEDEVNRYIDQILKLFEEECRKWFNTGNMFNPLHDDEREEEFSKLWRKSLK